MIKPLILCSDGQLHCPTCGHDFLHFPKFSFKLKDMKEITIDNEGNVTIDTEKYGSGEHYDITLTYECECGHKGTICISHHEGSAFMYTKE